MEIVVTAEVHLKVGGITMLQVVICDDDIAILDTMKASVEKILFESDIRAKVLAFSDAARISNQILSGCDIAFLDIDFENKAYNGMDMARKIRALRKDTIIIFVTNFIEYAPEGYEVQAFRYILKRDLDTDLKPILLLALKQLNKESLVIQVNGEVIKLKLDDILYLEVQQHSVTTFVQKSSRPQQKYTFYASLSDIEAQLEPKGFLRIHKSYLVNMKHLKKFQCREATLDNGIQLRVGEKSYAEKKQVYLLWKGWQ